MGKKKDSGSHDFAEERTNKKTGGTDNKQREAYHGGSKPKKK